MRYERRAHATQAGDPGVRGRAADSGVQSGGEQTKSGPNLAERSHRRGPSSPTLPPLDERFLGADEFPDRPGRPRGREQTKKHKKCQNEATGEKAQ